VAPLTCSALGASASSLGVIAALRAAAPDTAHPDVPVYRAVDDTPTTSATLCRGWVMQGQRSERDEDVNGRT
jgi:hypothetical protein